MGLLQEIIVVVLLLLRFAASFVVFAANSDHACLSSLKHSLTDPSGKLAYWTPEALQSPCRGVMSDLEGVTCNNDRVYKLALSGCSLGGTLSPFLSNCSNLQTLDLSSNSITGTIPPEISSLLNLAVLNLSGNSLSGPIPPELALCAYLNVIDFHGNQLTGPIPPQLGLLVRLTSFDISDNRLSGPIPTLLSNRTSNLPRFNASSFEGNKDVYGYPLSPATGKGLSVLAIVGIGLGSGMLSLVVSFTFVCLWLRVTEDRRKATEEEGKVNHFMPDY